MWEERLWNCIQSRGRILWWLQRLKYMLTEQSLGFQVSRCCDGHVDQNKQLSRHGALWRRCGLFGAVLTAH